LTQSGIFGLKIYVPSGNPGVGLKNGDPSLHFFTRAIKKSFQSFIKACVG
jgi:hypothetical protein